MDKCRGRSNICWVHFTFATQATQYTGTTNSPHIHMHMVHERSELVVSTEFGSWEVRHWSSNIGHGAFLHVWLPQKNVLRCVPLFTFFFHLVGNSFSPSGGELNCQFGSWGVRHWSSNIGHGAGNLFACVLLPQKNYALGSAFYHFSPSGGEQNSQFGS